MREPVKDKGRLEHILKAIDNIERFLQNVPRESFRADEVLYYAIVKNIEIIGEAAYMLTPEFREEHTSVDWRSIIAMRHVLVHGYYQLSEQEIWDTAKYNLPPLREQIEALMKL